MAADLQDIEIDVTRARGLVRVLIAEQGLADVPRELRDLDRLLARVQMDLLDNIEGR